jgi:hypothetical protein
VASGERRRRYAADEGASMAGRIHGWAAALGAGRAAVAVVVAVTYGTWDMWDMGGDGAHAHMSAHGTRHMTRTWRTRA